MRKTVLCLLLLFAALASANAKVEFCPTGGLTFSFADVKNMTQGNFDTIKNGTSWFAGVDLRFPFTQVWALTAGARYSSLGASLISSVNPDSQAQIRTGYVEVPVNVQCSLDLMGLRPYLEAGAFGGYMVSNSASGVAEGTSFNKIEAGVRAGLGLQIWKIDIKAMYNYNFLPLITSSGASSRLSFVTLSLAFVL